MNKIKNISELLIEQVERNEKLKQALINILSNTIRIEPSVYQSGVLTNIEMALGKEEYDYWVNYYE